MNNYFCVLPFFSTDYRLNGSKPRCPLIPNDSVIEDVKTSMLHGVRSPHCGECWKIEDAGLISDRKIKNDSFCDHYGKNIEIVEEEVKQGKYYPAILSLYTSNTCNSTCIMCSSYCSSAWAPLERKLNIIPHSASSVLQEEIDKIDFSSVVMLSFLGGEPMYEKRNFQILEKLLQCGNNKCFVAFGTNGSIVPTTEQVQLLSKFKNLNFNVSIDGIGPVFEYHRYPLKWDILVKNLLLLKSLAKWISIGYVTTNVNVLYHHETINWFKEQNLIYNCNPVRTPHYLRPSSLSLNVKNYIFNKFGRTNDLELFLGKEHTAQDDLDFETMRIEMQKQDAVKKIEMKHYLPELHSLLYP